MKKVFSYGIFILLLIGLFSPITWAKDNTNLPLPSGYVSDYAGVISAQDQASINALATELESKTTVQVAVVTVKSIAPQTIENYAVALFKKWGIGQRVKDNGVLFLIVPQDHALRIEVGYGLEGFLTDAMTSNIIHQIVVPQFKQGNSSEGILQGAKAIVSLIAKENGVTITGTEGVIYTNFNQDSSSTLWLIVFVFVMIFSFYASSFRRGGPGLGGYYGGGGFGGGFGGGSGGGFGGGGSGGGGSSGSW